MAGAFFLASKDKQLLFFVWFSKPEFCGHIFKSLACLAFCPESLCEEYFSTSLAELLACFPSSFFGLRVCFFSLSAWTLFLYSLAPWTLWCGGMTWASVLISSRCDFYFISLSFLTWELNFHLKIIWPNSKFRFFFKKMSRSVRFFYFIYTCHICNCN